MTRKEAPALIAEAEFPDRPTIVGAGFTRIDKIARVRFGPQGALTLPSPAAAGEGTVIYLSHLFDV